MEYDILGLPKPDLVLFLNVDPVVAHKMVAQKDAKARKYAAGSKYDVLEADLEHQRNALKQSLSMLDSNYNWKKINCMDKNRLLSKGEVADLVWQTAKSRLKK
jgi:dTMP kinase